ncbi:MAG: translation initiation factor IF-5A [Candidatus Methylarchaceae archaeon HK01B]|nr:translation initiation factor IF-5A [Candidatus Methylarchaceae archaeon HK02M1]MCP8318960.1 translation initiation factor IF-5A [Candidatus Methylarchaceae archaeon HK01B]
MKLSKPVNLGSLKTGSYIMIDDEACRIVSYDKSKPGKHGSAKARVVAIGLYDGVKRSMVAPVSSMVHVPIVEKRGGQVIAIIQDKIQVMDLETFEVFESPMPDEPELKERISSGIEVEYWNVLGKRKIIRTKG